MKIQPTFIGIVGPSGAGKSSSCKTLKKESKLYEHIKLDNYFKSPKTFPKKIRISELGAAFEFKV